MFGLLFLLIALPFRVLFLFVRIMSALLDHAGRRHSRRRYRSRSQAATGGLSFSEIARQRRFWQVVVALVLIGFIGSHLVPSMAVVALGLGVLLLVRQQNSRRETATQQRREAETEAERAHARAVAALRPEDIQWLRAAGWNGPLARGTGTLTR